MRSIAAIVILSLAGSAQAMGAECDGSGNQMELNACAAREYGASDMLLNQTYRKVTANLSLHPQSKRDAELLTTAQRAWLTFRDAYCVLVGDAYDGGSVQPFVVNTCLSEITLQRVKQLETILDSP